jgi:hypothetical protein
VVSVSLVIVTFGLGALNTLDVFFVQRNLGAPIKYYGFLGAALGAGMLAGSALASAIAARFRLEQMRWGSLAAVGLVVLIYARMTSLIPVIVDFEGRLLVREPGNGQRAETAGSAPDERPVDAMP